jgi:hypothetical protein
MKSILNAKRPSGRVQWVFGGMGAALPCQRLREHGRRYFSLAVSKFAPCSVGLELQSVRRARWARLSGVQLFAARALCALHKAPARPRKQTGLRVRAMLDNVKSVECQECLPAPDSSFFCSVK